MKKAFELLFPIIGICVLLYFIRSTKNDQTILDKAATTTVVKGDHKESSVQDPAQEFGHLVKKVDKGIQPGFILYPSVGDYKVRLLDLDANVVNEWAVDAMRARLLSDCSLLVVHGSKVGKDHEHWGGLINTVRRYSWEGEVLWEYTAPERIHHDIRLTSKGNYLMPYKQMIDANLFRQHRSVPKHVKEIKSDRVVIVDGQGDTLWDWQAHQHLDLSSCGQMTCSDQHNQTGWTHLNTVSEIPENKWYKAGDTRFKPGNIMIMLRNWWQPLIIDRESKKVVWSYEGDYRGGLSGGHEAVMIPEGLPGAGNILVFDNGRKKHQGESIVLEINPTSNQIVWKYEDGKKFFSHSAGMAQRLANGNTFISQDADGYRAFEVDPEGEILWEFQGVQRTSRVRKYGIDHCSRLSKL